MATKLTYSEQLKHPNWQRKRLEMLNAADFQCTKCRATEKTLHVHHKKYVKGRKAWEYAASELAVLCEDCHQGEHAAEGDFDALMALTWQTGEMSAREIAHGFLGGFFLPFEPVAHDMVERSYEYPFFDIGFMVAALGPDDLKDAIRRKIAEGRLPDHEFLRQTILGEEAGD